MLKFFKNPFAVSGSKVTIPPADPGTGAVSYPTGYGSDYELASTDPASRNIERTGMNGLFFDLTNEVRLLQSQGIPDFITSALNEGAAFSYDVGAVCRYSGVVYVSRKTANTSLPTVAADWSPVQFGGTPRATAGGSANTVTATFTPVLALADGDMFAVQHGAANTGAVTLNLNGSGAVSVYKSSNLPLAAGDIPGANFWALYAYDSSLAKFQLLNPAQGGTSTASSFTLPNWLGGFTIQWGSLTFPASGSSVSGLTATFSTPFTTALYFAYVIPQGPANSVDGGWAAAGINGSTLADVDFVLDALGFTTFDQTVPAVFFAIGK